MMKNILLFSGVLIAFALGDPEKISEIPQWQIPESMKKELLAKTGAKEIISIDKVVYRRERKYDVLAFSAQLKNFSDLQGPIKEGVMYVSVAFIQEKNKRTELYNLDIPLAKILTLNENDLYKGMIKYK